LARSAFQPWGKAIPGKEVSSKNPEGPYLVELTVAVGVNKEAPVKTKSLYKVNVLEYGE